jgi:hypothetical protein
MLNDGEIQEVYEKFKKADLGQLMSLAALSQQLLDAMAKDGNEKLFWMLDFYERDKRRKGGGKEDE